MVFVNEKKFACQTCIKGHRSSGCKHTDRPLFEIKKKGRPVTQCDHCRELRKTKQVHVKCQCDSRDDGTGTPGPSGKRGRMYGPVAPAYPNGLRVDSPIPPSSESTSNSPRLPTCSCGTTGDCKCWSPRHQVRHYKGSSGSSLSSIPSSISDIPTSRIWETNAALSMSSRHSMGNPLPLPGLDMSPTHGTPVISQYPMSHSASHSQVSFNSSSSIQYPPTPRESQDSFHYDPSFPGVPSQHSPHSAPPFQTEFVQPWTQYSPSTASLAPVQLSTPAQCACGKCACMGCSEHSNFDGAPSPSPFCTTGCMTGTGCGNSLHGSTLISGSTDRSLPDGVMPQQQHPYSPTQTPSTPYLSSPQSALSSDVRYSWMSRSVEDTRRTSFATSIERGTASTGSSMGGGGGLVTPAAQIQSGSYLGRNTNIDVAPLSSPWPGLSVFSPQSAPTRQQQRSSNRSPNSQLSITTSAITAPTPTPAPAPSSPTARSAAAVKRGLKRLLPRPSSVEIQPEIATTPPSSDILYQQVTSLARAPAYMPFNPHM